MNTYIFFYRKFSILKPNIIFLVVCLQYILENKNYDKHTIIDKICYRHFLKKIYPFIQVISSIYDNNYLHYRPRTKEK